LSGHPIDESADTRRHAFGEMPAWPVAAPGAVPDVHGFGAIGAEADFRSPEIVRQHLVAHYLRHGLAEGAAGQHDQAIHRIGGEPHPLTDMQAEIGIAAQLGAGIEQAQIIGGRQCVRRRIERSDGHARRPRQGARLDACLAGRLQQRLQIGADDPGGVRNGSIVRWHDWTSRVARSRKVGAYRRSRIRRSFLSDFAGRNKW
jgi:hypothetical protein